MIKTLKSVHNILSDLLEQIEKQNPQTVPDVIKIIQNKQDSILILTELCQTQQPKVSVKKKKR